jgi:NADPH-dependent 2,4-dienoyl-CoA reductase/sulfur reductase-like enzyme
MTKTTDGADEATCLPLRRDANCLTLVGRVGGPAAMYRAMTTLGFTAELNYTGPINLQGAPKGSSVLILGAGIAGLVATCDLRRAAYQVTVIEYHGRAGGRAWTIRGGDEHTELGGYKQKCEFDKGQYLNTSPWRIPFHHPRSARLRQTVRASAIQQELVSEASQFGIRLGFTVPIHDGLGPTAALYLIGNDRNFARRVDRKLAATRTRG